MILKEEARLRQKELKIRMMERRLGSVLNHQKKDTQEADSSILDIVELNFSDIRSPEDTGKGQSNR